MVEWSTRLSVFEEVGMQPSHSQTFPGLTGLGCFQVLIDSPNLEGDIRRLGPITTEHKEGVAADLPALMITTMQLLV